MGCAQNIRAFRENRGMTQRQLADAVNVTPGAVAHWELGSNTPSLPKLMALADLFGCTLDALTKAPVEQSAS